MQLSDEVDPETGERLTAKRYESEKSASQDGTSRHVKVTLKPENPEFDPIELAVEDEDRLRVVAEMVEVL